ncbi:DNA-3-methyladenine glycosylase I [Oceanicoccus sp. KOV_DT_Chl]|uniref:DNA-3-methyladenine glycosylase I n=1 Tax=Oceanicoccus sp. KOV_DT_Chl TaxID=1904639 RepID=UPI000C7E4891|nr:DNA-3-methyladenine glycosylase I [Oceanicoccus sp. KOV_DT_Chl]
MDSLKRCSWCGDDPIYQQYHDQEWGVPVTDDKQLFEFLILEGAQAGLSWITILKKREGYRKAFANFDVKKVARFSDAKLEKLLLDPSIVRNRLKVFAARTNAQAFIKVQQEFGSFSDYIWGFVDGKPIQNRWQSMAQVPATSPESDRLSKDLKKRGFKFVGSTIIYAHMQATGMVNDHIKSCFRYPQLK